jgi:heavy metal sensor kinase
MRFERLRAFCQTLRCRLTIWNTAVVVLLLLVYIAVIHDGLQFTRMQMVDEFIQEELYSAVRDFERLGDEPDRLHIRFDRQATGHPRRQLFLQVLDERGRLVWSSEQSPPPDVLPLAVLPLDAPVTAENYRILCREVPRPGGRVVTLRIGCSLGRAYLDIDRFSRILLTAGALLFLVVPLGGYLLAGRATRPIAQIIDTTARLDPSRLQERLHLRGSHDELDKLSRTINGLLDRIAAYVQQGREFTANAAHELRSPLTALQSSLEVALNADRTVEEYKEVLAVLLEECGHMRVLVNQLLILAEGDAVRIPLRPQALRLDQIVGNSLEMFQVVAEAAEVQLTARGVEPILIRGDGNRLWQLVNNLLDNAVKFTPPSGRIVLDCWLDEPVRQAVLVVKDTGIGITADDLPHIFERFYQGDKARQRENPSRGTGLGLSICLSVVAAHGGTIDVASTPGEGSTFTVRLPDCSCPDLASERPGAASARPGKDGEKIAERA